MAVFAWTPLGSLSLAVHAQQSRTVKDGVYTDAQARRGQAIYKERCSTCHGDGLEGLVGPALTGDDFLGVWGKQTLSDLVDKIQTTMPADNPGQLARPQAADVVAYVLQIGKFPSGQGELGSDEAVLKQIALVVPQTPSSRPPTTAGQAPAFPPFGNLAQVMRGILFPSSNIIFDVQTRDPGAKKVVGRTAPDSSLTERLADVYQGWVLVDFAAVALVDTAPLMLTPGRRCENGKPVPVDRPDWIKFTQDLAEAGRVAYKASQSRNQDAVIEATNAVSDACLNCHQAYRDRRGGNAARCMVGG
jgi:mono/diheme cytochrome c family protein